MKPNISISGNIGKEPEIRFSPSGTAFTSLSVAVTPRVKKGNDWVDGTTIWFKVPFFGEKAEKIVDTYSKGVRVKISGQLNIGTPWTDKSGLHHDGGWEIGNAEVELDPWEKTAKSAPKAESGVSWGTPNLPAQPEVAPF